MHKIAVISDTHGILKEEVLRQAASCEAIFHAGDIDNQKVIDKLREIAPVYVVKGNTDKAGNGWTQDIPEELYFNLYGFNFYIVHNKKNIKADTLAADIIIYGHSHKYKEEYLGNILYLNPGSCGPGRFRLAVTMAVITLYEETHTFTVEKIQCIKAAEESRAEENTQDSNAQNTWKDMYSLVKKIIKDMDSGKSIPVIAKKNGVPEELAEKICRIYSTHQQIDVDGILNRLDIWNL